MEGVRVLVHLQSSVPCWNVGDDHLGRLRREFPSVVFTVARTDEEVLPGLAHCDVFFGWSFREGWLQRAPHLKWVATPAAGVDVLEADELAPAKITVTRGGFHGAIMSETLLAMMLHFARCLDACATLKAERRWSKEPLYPARLIAGATLVVVGAGSIGGHIARKASALGMRVLGLRRRPDLAPEGFDTVFPMDRLDEVLGHGDHIACVLPASEDTAGLIGQREFAAMKPSAFFYNLGRGNCVDEDALCAALREGRLAGAGLDVFQTEPLPPDSPLWGMGNVLISPHAGAIAPQYLDLAVDQFAGNLHRFLDGQPLAHIVNAHEARPDDSHKSDVPGR